MIASSRRATATKRSPGPATSDKPLAAVARVADVLASDPILGGLQLAVARLAEEPLSRTRAAAGADEEQQYAYAD